MDSKVKVASKDGKTVIVKSTNNTEYGHIRVVQTRMMIDESGFARKKELSALIPGTIENLAAFGWEADQEIDGKIVVKERMEPFNKKNPEKDIKMAGDSGVPCKIDGQPIYRKCLYTFSTSAEDVELDHDNKEEIKAGYAAKEESGSAVSPNEDFSI